LRPGAKHEQAGQRWAKGAVHLGSQSQGGQLLVLAFLLKAQPPPEARIIPLDAFQVGRYLLRIEVFQRCLTHNVRIEGGLAATADKGEDFVIGHTPVGIADANVAAAVEASRTEVAGLLVIWALGHLSDDDLLPFNLDHTGFQAQRRDHPCSHIAQFGEHLVHIPHTGGGKPLGFIKAKDDDTAAGAVGESR